MRLAKQFLLCQSISAELQRLITRHSRKEKLSRADVDVKTAAGKVMTFFFGDQFHLGPDVTNFGDRCPEKWHL